MAKKPRDESRPQQAREAQPCDGDHVAQDRRAVEEPLDEQSLDWVMRECPL